MASGVWANHAQYLKVHFSFLYKRQAAQQKLPKFGFRIHTTALWPVEQSSLSAKFDRPVAR